MQSTIHFSITDPAFMAGLLSMRLAVSVTSLRLGLLGDACADLAWFRVPASSEEPLKASERCGCKQLQTVWNVEC